MKFNSSILIILCLSTFLLTCTKDKTRECDIDPSYLGDVAPFFNTYCISCHNANTASGGIILDNYENVSNQIDYCISQFREGLMPPYGSISPDSSERDSILELLNCWSSMGKKNN